MEIVYQDEVLLVVNKPAGLLVHRSPLDSRETLTVVRALREQLGRPVYAAHRLDKPTSGLLVFSLCPEAIRTLTADFASRAVHKDYLAVVRGWTEDAGTIDHPMADPWDRLLHGEKKGEMVKRDAVTDFITLDRCELAEAVGRYATARYALVQLSPRTGRRHQLRRHCKHLHHPILGDTKYGDGEHTRFLRAYAHCQRMLLHAWRLQFRHPVSGVPLTLTAPLPADFSQALDALRLSHPATSCS